MKPVVRRWDELPHRVEVHEHVWIPMSDGARLAAKLWIPDGAEHDPVPAILEYIPYRKRDFTAVRDAMHHPWFAGHGYASIRVDLRGSGESDGVLADEYLEQELADGEEVLAWIAAQPWCDGKVGMIGISWGGFNGLQLAERQPPELGAVVSVCSTDDRYSDDVHYMGGCMLSDNLSWGSTMFAYNTLPPDPAIVGDRWREMWLERLERSGLWLDTWLRHQHRDDYWKHGSICENFDAVQVPVYAVSGWADGYSNAVFRLVESLRGPVKGLIGPWSHKYPHIGVPGPAINFLQECLRWWDQWLKGRDTGIMDEPVLRAWMQDSVPPTTGYSVRPGRWVAEPSWPSPNVEWVAHPLSQARIEPPGTESDPAELTIQSPLSVGLFAGKWCSFAATPDLPHDQREEDGGALVFDSDPLDEPLEIVGAPVVELDLESNRPRGMVAVRLSDIAPDDKATRVTYGLLNLAHRDSHEHPELLEPGKRYTVRVELNGCAQTFPAGHKLRVAISTSYWPLAWPPPEPVRLTVRTDTSRLLLPVRPVQDSDADILEFGPPEIAETPSQSMVAPGEANWHVKRDLASDVSTLEVIKDDGAFVLDDIDLEVSSSTHEWYAYERDMITSPRGEVIAYRGLAREGWRISTRTRTVLTCTETDFLIHAELDAFEDDRRVFSANWNRAIPRGFL